MSVENCFFKKQKLKKLNPHACCEAGPWCYIPKEQKVGVSVSQGSK